MTAKQTSGLTVIRSEGSDPKISLKHTNHLTSSCFVVDVLVVVVVVLIIMVPKLKN